MTLFNHQGLLVALSIVHFLATSFPSVSAISFPTPNHGSWDEFTTYTRGHNYKGLSNVKNYFHHLGYIPNPNNYNLDITGKLDNNTLRQLTTPRCGVPDIINTNTTTQHTQLHIHTVSHYSFFNGAPRWPAGTRQLTYAFSPELNLNCAAKSLFARAFNSGDHNDGLPFDGPLGEWAHAFAPTNGWCHFDADEYWVASGDVTQSPVARAVDLESIAVHEIGHLLGLHHSSDQRAIMYAYLPPRTRKVNLAQDDINGIRHLYCLWMLLNEHE
uniref:Peptidase metallopeptidase domain-containing protein n=1 Tax=Glycine max TaxID=3847 RepID=A0A0R0KYB1_SOYBN